MGKSRSLCIFRMWHSVLAALLGTREGCLSAVPRVGRLPEVHKVDEARLEHCFSVVIGICQEALEPPRVGVARHRPCRGDRQGRGAGPLCLAGPSLQSLLGRRRSASARPSSSR